MLQYYLCRATYDPLPPLEPPESDTGIPQPEFRYPDCRPGCEAVFARVWVFSQIVGGTRVEWQLKPTFRDPGPHSFQLQVGRTANQNADDWRNVGLPAHDNYFAIDPEQRVWGKTQWTHYRVVLRTPVATYVSAPQPAWGALNFRDWRLCQDILRQERLRFRTQAGQQGYLLKRRLYGEPDTGCLDFQTGDVSKPQCPVCYGTGFVGGYFPPLECVWAQLDTRASHDELDAGAGRGTINDALRVKARMLAIPQVEENDFWVDADSDLRWYVHSVENIVEVRGVPLVCTVELRLAPYSEVIYKFPIPNQVPSF